MLWFRYKNVNIFASNTLTWNETIYWSFYTISYIPYDPGVNILNHLGKSIGGSTVGQCNWEGVAAKTTDWKGILHILLVNIFSII